MFKNKELEYVERAFQIERESYSNAIVNLRDRVYKLEAELKSATNATIKDLSSETIKQLEVEKENLQVQNELFSTADTVQAEPDVPVKDYGSFKKTDANSGYRSSVSVDVNDLNTPACLRKNLSRTINFDRK